MFQRLTILAALVAILCVTLEPRSVEAGSYRTVYRYRARPSVYGGVVWRGVASGPSGYIVAPRVRAHYRY